MINHAIFQDLPISPPVNPPQSHSQFDTSKDFLYLPFSKEENKNEGMGKFLRVCHQHSQRLKSLWFMANCFTSAHFLPVIAVLLGTDWIESGCHRILHSEFRGSSLCPRVLLGALRVGHWMHSKWGLGGILPGASIFHAQSRDHGTNLELMTGKPVIIYNIMGLTTCRFGEVVANCTFHSSFGEQAQEFHGSFLKNAAVTSPEAYRQAKNAGTS